VFPRRDRLEHGDGPVPHDHCKTVTLIAAIRLGGAGGRLAFDGATDAVTFGSYVEWSWSRPRDAATSW